MKRDDITEYKPALWEKKLRNHKQGRWREKFFESFGVAVTSKARKEKHAVVCIGMHMEETTHLPVKCDCKTADTEGKTIVLEKALLMTARWFCSRSRERDGPD